MTQPPIDRPLSPHLSIYRWQITNTLSILHRMTGAGLTVGLVLFALWLMAAAWCPTWFALLSSFFASILGKLFLFGWTAAFYYHLGNGLRHLNWDLGKGMRIPEVTSSGRLVVLFALVLIVITWIVIVQKVGL